MTRKIYRTAQGKQIDLGALLLQNEHVRAVGNMNVNARGDLLDSQNKPIDTRNKQVARNYKKQVSNVQADTVYSSKQKIPAAPLDIPVPPEDFDEIFTPPPMAQPAADKQERGAPAAGLAGAIARARSVKQEPLTPPNSKTANKPITKI